MIKRNALFALLAIVLMSFVSVAVANYGPDPPDYDQVSIVLDIEEAPVVAPAAMLLSIEGDRFLGPGDITSSMQVILRKLSPHYRLYNINYLRPITPNTLHYAQIGYGLWN